MRKVKVMGCGLSEITADRLLKDQEFNVIVVEILTNDII